MKKLMSFFAIISGILWGSGGIFVRTLTNMEMNAYTIISTRVMVAVFIIFIGLMIYDKNLFKIRLKDVWIFIVAGMIGMFGINLCYNFAIKDLTLSLAAVLLSMSPIFVLILAALFFKEKITKKKLLCMFLALTGCALVSGVFENASGMQWSVRGILIGLLSALFYAIYSLITKVAMKRGYHAFTITFYSLLTVLLVVLPLTDWQITVELLERGGIKMGMFMLIHSLCTSVLPYILFTVSLAYIDAGKASILAACEPIAAMIFGVIFFSEIPTMLSVGGLVLATIAITIMTLPEKK
jgi:drug/metabolite transporter (DMT)-like permease